MRKTFQQELLKAMSRNDNIYLLTGDLGYKMFDLHRETYPQRAINCGASEQAMLDIAVGMAYDGKIPFAYTITPFLLRGFETIRTYINHENLQVKLVGSGRDKDYAHDGFSHDASDIKDFLDPMKNIVQFFPEDKGEIPDVLEEIIKNEKPSFISLKR